MNEERQWVPEICYEEVEDGLTSHIPFIEPPNDVAMPKILFIFESRSTGETEPGLDGEEVPIVELNLHQYANMNSLRDQLPQGIYDIIRLALGLESLATAVEGGKKITENIRAKLNDDVE